MAFHIWNGTNGAWSTPGNWYPNGVPASGDVATITAGRVTVSGVDTSYRTILVDAIRGNVATELSLNGVSLGVGSNTYLVGYGNVASLTLNNAVTDGVLVDSYGPGEVVVPSGSYAVNRGWWAISSTTNSSLTTIAYGNFINAGAIESGSHASFALSMQMGEQNYGMYQVDPGGKMMFLSGGYTPATFDTMTNLGNIFVNGGLMYMAADVSQIYAGKTTIAGGGTLTLAGKYDGGTIEINAGTLNFIPTPTDPVPYSASELNSSIAFTGQSGEIDLGEAILSATYRPDTNDIQVMVPWKGDQAQAADFHLDGGPGSYSASNFDVNTQTGQIIYHKT
jgi:hypothetical protein